MVTRSPRRANHAPTTILNADSRSCYLPHGEAASGLTDQGGFCTRDAAEVFMDGARLVTRDPAAVSSRGHPSYNSEAWTEVRSVTIVSSNSLVAIHRYLYRSPDTYIGLRGLVCVCVCVFCCWAETVLTSGPWWRCECDTNSSCWLLNGNAAHTACLKSCDVCKPSSSVCTGLAWATSPSTCSLMLNSVAVSVL